MIIGLENHSHSSWQLAPAVSRLQCLVKKRLREGFGPSFTVYAQLKCPFTVLLFIHCNVFFFFYRFLTFSLMLSPLVVPCILASWNTKMTPSCHGLYDAVVRNVQHCSAASVFIFYLFASPHGEQSVNYCKFPRPFIQAMLLYVTVATVLSLQDVEVLFLFIGTLLR